MDSYIFELDKRLSAYEEINTNYSFFRLQILRHYSRISKTSRLFEEVLF